MHRSSTLLKQSGDPFGYTPGDDPHPDVIAICRAVRELPTDMYISGNNEGETAKQIAKRGTSAARFYNVREHGPAAIFDVMACGLHLLICGSSWERSRTEGGDECEMGTIGNRSCFAHIPELGGSRRKGKGAARRRRARSCR